MATLIRDGNRVTIAGGQSSTDSTVVLPIQVDSTTGRVLVDASASFAIITMTGTVDDSNTSFTASSTPTVVVINGSSYRDGHGVTISDTSVTTDSPVGTGGDIYGL